MNRNGSAPPDAQDVNINIEEKIRQLHKVTSDVRQWITDNYPVDADAQNVSTTRTLERTLFQLELTLFQMTGYMLLAGVTMQQLGIHIDELNHAHMNALAEKDRRIADLEKELAEARGGK